jgi:hypothetical protein
MLVSASDIIAPASAASYEFARITHIYTQENGVMLIKWTGSPSPGPCGGTNNGWVEIAAAAAREMKAMALAIYAAGLPARIETSGCIGARERVTSIYSPSG